ncbi:MAG: hypothetical protein F4092_06280 [Rhodospirillaceae bacterium]|nr:hypothetical protein [Rhodospirillaceae bacterium]
MSQQTKKIDIDIDVNRVIEAKRTAFGQSHNAILREIFGLTTSGPPPVAPVQQRTSKSSRRTGTYAFNLIGERVEAGSLKAAYVTCLRKLSDLDAQLLERLSKVVIKTRRIVAKKPEDLYLRSPQLAEKYAAQFKDSWWIDTNLSRPQVEKRLEEACKLLGLKFGSSGGDLILDFPG